MRGITVRVLAAVVGVAVAAGVGGCDTEHERVQKKTIGLMGEYADVLEGIKTNAEFVDAKPKIEKIGAKLKDAMNEMTKLPKPSAEEEKKLEARFREEGEKVSKRIGKEMERLAGVGVSPMDLMGAMAVTPAMFEK